MQDICRGGARFSSRDHHIMILSSQEDLKWPKFRATLGEPKRFFAQISETFPAFPEEYSVEVF